MTPDNVVAIDFETAEIGADGKMSVSLDFYKRRFRATSCAFAWREDGELKTAYVTGEPAIAAFLSSLGGAKVIAHNQQFDYGVAMCRFPNIPINWHADSMRLCQLYDNGGDKFYIPPPSLEDIEEAEEEGDLVKRNPLHGLSLSACVKRILCDDTDHKEAAYKILRDLGVAEGQEKINLHMLPAKDMEAYNVADAVNSLRLYNFISIEFANQEYDWSTDNALFQFMLDRMVRSKIEGVRIDRKIATESVTGIEKELADIRKRFAERMMEPIQTVERRLLDKRLQEYKTERGRQQYLNSGRQKEECAFNPTSTLQLTMLFVETLGMSPKFTTKKGRPSFKSVYLSQWGEGGMMLQKLKKLGIVLAQLKSLLDLSAYDGTWHLDIKLCGTSTGRMAGGSHE